MTQDEIDRATFDGFTLAVRVMLHAFEIDEPGTEFERPWSLVRDIAEGRATLTSPAELTTRFPQLRQFIYDRVNRVIASDREAAQRVLRGLGSSF